MKKLMVDLLDNEEMFLNSKYEHFFDDISNSFKNGNEIILDLPYLDLDKLDTYVENGYLIIKYKNPNDKRRKSYNYTLYVGDDDVKLSYENGFLKIEKEKKTPERKIIKISN